MNFWIMANQMLNIDPALLEMPWPGYIFVKELVSTHDLGWLDRHMDSLVVLDQPLTGLEKLNFDLVCCL